MRQSFVVTSNSTDLGSLDPELLLFWGHPQARQPRLTGVLVQRLPLLPGKPHNMASTGRCLLLAHQQHQRVAAFRPQVRPTHKPLVRFQQRLYRRVQGD
jgi:hypothetical protein